MTKQSKYNVSSDKTKRTFHDIIFDSVLEKRFYEEVVLPDFDSGKITSFELQKKYVLQPAFKHNEKHMLPITYIADFVILYPDGHEEVIDVKGNVDNVFAIKKKMLLFHYPAMKFRCVAYSKIDGGWVDRDYIIKQRNFRKKEKAAKTAR